MTFDENQTWDEYDERFGVDFVTVHFDDRDIKKAVRLMRLALDGKRGPVTDDDFGGRPPGALS